MAEFESAPLRVDWGLLRSQMDLLGQVQTHISRRDPVALDRAHFDAVEGVLNLLGALKDLAVDRAGLPERDVFGPELPED